MTSGFIPQVPSTFRQDCSPVFKLPSKLVWLASNPRGFTWLHLHRTEITPAHFKKENMWIMGIELRPLHLQKINFTDWPLSVSALLGRMLNECFWGPVSISFLHHCSFLIFIALFLPFLTFYSISHALSLYAVLFVFYLRLLWIVMGNLIWLITWFRGC